VPAAGVRAGVYAALAGAFLFGASTPVAKLLVGALDPLLLAGLLYAGSGAGLTAWLLVRRARPGAARAIAFARSDYPWLAGAVAAGGIAAPVLLMLGLAKTEASSAALLLNLEGVFTALIAWFAFRENFDRRILLGMALIVAGGALLAWRPGGLALAWPALAVALACLLWAIDNNLTRKISAGDAVLIAAVKGVVAGAVNLSLAWTLGAAAARPALYLAAGVVGFAGYGVSLALFVVALRQLGAARTAAYFSTAPFLGAALAFALLGESQTPLFWIAALLMAAGVALHLAERHAHGHAHEPVSHEHPHVHDEHHRHEHDAGWDGEEPHTHAHTHEPLRHDHPHYPDIHHRHSH
jgi:drug/metabolite transporter (DMT)-like permease